MVTDLAQVRRLATGKEAENLEFRRYLKARHIPHKPLEQIAHETAAHIDCTACANCCRETVVQPSAEDIARLSEYLKLPEKRVLALYTEPDHSGPHGIRLKQPQGACAFLDGNVCLVYDARPRACRDFPCVETADNTLGARMESVCRSSAFCPIIYNALEEYKAVTGFEAAMRSRR